MLTNRINILKAASDETRLRLLWLLSRGERTVKDLTDILGQSQPRISRHLKLLTDAGLIERAPEGAWVYYGLSDDETVRAIVGPMLTGLDESDLTIRRDSEQLERIKQRNQDAASAYFAKHAEQWDIIRNMHAPDADIESAILQAAGPGPFHAVLDIGTGTGRMLELFAPHARRATGIDLSPAMLAIARSNLERAGHAHIHVRTGDANNLPVVRDGFDLVIVHQVLHYLDDPARAIAQAAQTLAPGGRLLVVDFAPHAIEELRASHAHRRLGFGHKQLAQWMSEAGLTPEPATDLPPSDTSGQALTVTLFPAVAAAQSDRRSTMNEGQNR